MERPSIRTAATRAAPLPRAERHDARTQPYWLTLGTPTAAELHGASDGWRWALWFTGPAGVADGVLRALPPASEPDAARAAALRKAEEFTRRGLGILWHPAGRPGRWTGTVTATGPRPPA